MPKPTKQNEALQSRYRERLTHARKYRDQENLPSLWARMADLYRGKHWPSGLRDQDLMVVNHAKAIIDVIVPSVSVSDPAITVNARRPEESDRAVIAETAVNYEWRHRRFTPTVMSCVKDGLIFGVGWGKVGWRFVEEWADDHKAYEATVAAQMGEIDTYASDNPDLAGDVPTEADVRASTPMPKQSTVKADHPFLERVSIFDVYVDPEATCEDDITWIAQKIRKTLAEVRVNDSYDKWTRERVSADSRLPDDWARSDNLAQREERQRVTIWEFYDLKAGTMCVFADAGPGFLVPPTKQPYSFGHPFVPFVDYQVPDQFYGMGELEAIEPLQHELNYTRTAVYNDAKAQRRRWLARAGAFDEQGRQALESDDDNVVIPVIGNTPLADVLVPVPSNPLNPQMYQNSDLIERDISDVTGVSEYQRGGTSDIRRTATEASIIQDASNSRAAHKMASVEAFMSGIARRLLMLMQQYATEEQVARYAGQNGKPLWVSYKPEWIAGEFDFEIETGSTQPRNDTSRRQAAIQMMQALGPLAVPGGPVNPQALVTYVLKYGFQIGDPSAFVQEAQSPMGMPPQEGMPGPNGEPPQIAGPGGPPQGGPPAGSPPPGAGAGQSQGGAIPEQSGGVPPEILAQLAGQVGLPPLASMGQG